VVYAIASVGVALTSSLAPFLALRALQGAANAFTTPLLVTALARMTATASLGQAMGTFASVQTAGVVFAPLVGGVAGAIDYRLAFVVPAAVALLLATAPLPADERRAEPPRLRSALTARTLVLSGFALLGYLSTIGLGVIVALRAADEFGMSAGARGLLLAGFGLAGVVAGRPIGRLIDRRSALGVLVAGCAASAVILPLVGVSETVALLTITWTVAGFASQMLWGTVYTLAVTAAPANQAGAVSIIGACRFAGNALAPIVWLAAYHAHTWLPFVLAGAVMALLTTAGRRFR
jgi:MFS family permease